MAFCFTEEPTEVLGGAPLGAMETMSPSSSSRSARNEDSSFDGFFMEQSMFLSDSLKDLKNLRSQLYSAAEYFELSYTNDDKKQIVASSLKDYAVKAIVNTVDHLGSVANSVNGLLDENAHEVSGTELRVSCIEQRIRTCQEHIDREGRSQQSLVIAAPRYHKRYILPGAFMPDSGGQATAECQESDMHLADSESQEFQTAVCSKIRDRPPSSRKKHALPSCQRARSSSPSRKARSASPAPRHGNFSAKDRRVSSPNPSSPFSLSGKTCVTDKRAVSPLPKSPFSPGKFTATEKRALSPLPSSNPFARSGSFSCKPTVVNSTRRRLPSELQNSASLHLHAGRYDDKGIEQNTRKSRSFFKALLTKYKPTKDEMLYTYLDEY